MHRQKKIREKNENTKMINGKKARIHNNIQ